MSHKLTLWKFSNLVWSNGTVLAPRTTSVYGARKACTSSKKKFWKKLVQNLQSDNLRYILRDIVNLWYNNYPD